MAKILFRVNENFWVVDAVEAGKFDPCVIYDPTLLFSLPLLDLLSPPIDLCSLNIFVQGHMLPSHHKKLLAVSVCIGMYLLCSRVCATITGAKAFLLLPQRITMYD